MTNFTVSLPDSIAQKAEELATKDGVTMDQFIASAVTEKLSAWLTEAYIKERAARGDREKFLKILAKVPDVEPEEHDRL